MLYANSVLHCLVQHLPEEHSRDEADGERESLSLHLSHHLRHPGPQHHPCLWQKSTIHAKVGQKSQHNILKPHLGTHPDFVSSVTLFPDRFKILSDRNCNHFLLFNCGTRWLSFWLDFLSASVTLIVGLFVVLSPNEVINPALKGLALSYTIQVAHKHRHLLLWVGKGLPVSSHYVFVPCSWQACYSSWSGSLQKWRRSSPQWRDYRSTSLWDLWLVMIKQQALPFSVYTHWFDHLFYLILLTGLCVWSATQSERRHHPSRLATGGSNHF